jgi:hypothetical protein
MRWSLVSDGGAEVEESYVGALTLEALVAQRLRQLRAWRWRREAIITFPRVFSLICPPYSLKKEQAWAILMTLEQKGWLELVPYHGIRLREADEGLPRESGS